VPISCSEVKDGRLVRHHGCRCMKERWARDDSERERRRWVEFRWCGALARDEAKWRRGLVMRKVVKAEVTFL
jgi:hypothetical protein